MTPKLSRNIGKRDDTKTGGRFQGPFKVISKENDIYKLERVNDKKKFERHVKSLKRYAERVLSIIMLIINMGICSVIL